jgi:hypothetical protein
MKTFLTNLKFSFFIALALLSCSVFSKPIAQVTHMSGQVFMVSVDGKTKTLKVNDHIDEKSEVLVGEDGAITLIDYYDSTYHLLNGSHIKFFNKSVQLKSGKAWIQSTGSRHQLSVTTANGHVNYNKSDFVITFDQSHSKTQVLVIHGETEVSHVLDRNIKQVVTGGSFTTLGPEENSGLPRQPTKVGPSSLDNAIAEFKHLSPQKATMATPLREIASVESETTPAETRGKIIYFNEGKVMDRVPASLAGPIGPHQHWKKMMKRSKFSPSRQMTPIEVNFYGMDLSSSATEKPRDPASTMSEESDYNHKFDENLKAKESPGETLGQEKDSNPNHSKELNNLVNDLKNY